MYDKTLWFLKMFRIFKKSVKIIPKFPDFIQNFNKFYIKSNKHNPKFALIVPIIIYSKIFTRFLLIFISLKDGLIEVDVLGARGIWVRGRWKIGLKVDGLCTSDVWLNIYRLECPLSASALEDLFHCWRGGALYWR